MTRVTTWRGRRTALATSAAVLLGGSRPTDPTD